LVFSKGFRTPNQVVAICSVWSRRPDSWLLGHAQAWISYDIPTEHNKLVASSALRFCPQFESAALDGSLGWTQTSAVTAIAEVAKGAFVVCYNRVCCPTVRTDCHVAPPTECECNGSEFFCMRGHVE
jgi:hypothetical protein